MKRAKPPKFIILLAILTTYYGSLLALFHLIQPLFDRELSTATDVLITPQPETTSEFRSVFKDPEILSQIITRTKNKYKYEVWELRNVCISTNETVIYTATPAKAATLNAKYKGCKKGNDPFCACMKRSGVRFEALESDRVNFIAFDQTPTWLMYQWLPRHHVAHYAFSLVQFHSILLHSKHYDLPSFESILFQDNPSPLNNYEKSLLEIVKQSGYLANLRSIDFLSKEAQEYKPVKNETKCFQSIHTSRMSEVYSTNSEDLDVFRQSAERVLGLNITGSICPPNHAVILVRNKAKKGRQRVMKNIDQVIRLLNKKGIHHVDVVDLNGSQTLQQQASMISKYGLIISSHSSQLANLLFAHRNAVVMEMSVVYKPAFRTLGNMARLKYINSVGHRPDKSARSYIQKLFGRLEKTCNVAVVNGCNITSVERETLKSADYWVNLKTFERDLNEGIGFLNEKCGNKVWA
ncbi:UNVERIFIED_CONTAM: hypothetical protein HDU68_011060 [Siphonaria sp. JEL0065]|nr:hypothetical protein HDU68_011060 [Siphonaria sp. JEL0065]